jgi:hypothetical protein
VLPIAQIAAALTALPGATTTPRAGVSPDARSPRTIGARPREHRPGDA